MINVVAARVVSLAAEQWGLVTSAQAAAADVSRMQLQRMVQAGLLDRVMHGVYATAGVQGDQYLQLRAAWLMLDPRTSAERRLKDLPAAGVVAFASAAQMMGLGDLVADEQEFILPRRHQAAREGVRVRRGTLEASEITLVEGLPVTTAARTVADLLRIGHELEHVAAVVADALDRDLVDLPTLEAALTPVARRYKAPDGAELLNRLLDLAGMGRQDLERQMLDNDLVRELILKQVAQLEESQSRVFDLAVATAVQNVIKSISPVRPVDIASVAVVSSDIQRLLQDVALPATVTDQLAGVASARAAVEAMKIMPPIVDAPVIRDILEKTAQVNRSFDWPTIRAAQVISKQLTHRATAPVVPAQKTTARESE